MTSVAVSEPLNLSLAMSTRMSQLAMHYMEADAPMSSGVEGRRDCADDPEAEFLPERDGRCIGLHDGIELNCGITLLGGPGQHPPAQRSSDSAALRRRRDHE